MDDYFSPIFAFIRIFSEDGLHVCMYNLLRIQMRAQSAHLKAQNRMRYGIEIFWSLSDIGCIFLTTIDHKADISFCCEEFFVLCKMPWELLTFRDLIRLCKLHINHREYL